MGNVTDFPNREAVKEEAGSWLVRIDRGDLSAEEILAFQAWINSDSINRVYIEKLARSWDSMSVLQSLAELFPISPQESLAPKAQKTNNARLFFQKFRLFSYPRLQSVGVLGLVVSVSLAVLVYTLQPIKKIYSTGIGQQLTYPLDDGSSVTLNTNSQIEVDYTNDLRVVRLDHGEAVFRVAKVPSRPFIVYAGTGIVWAVGTVFNVRYTSELVDVTVTEGSVKVYAQVSQDNPVKKLADGADKHIGNDIEKNEIIIDAGQSVQYNDVIQQNKFVEAEAMEQKLAWHLGALVFKGETLEQVLSEVARYTDKELVIGDPELKNIRIGGHFKTNDLNGLLAALSQGFDIEVNQVSESRILLSQKKSL